MTSTINDEDSKDRLTGKKKEYRENNKDTLKGKEKETYENNKA